jgi:hypothetical protein
MPVNIEDNRVFKVQQTFENWQLKNIILTNKDGPCFAVALSKTGVTATTVEKPFI